MTPAPCLSTCWIKAGGFAGLQDTHDFVRLGRFKIGLDKLIAPAFGGIQNGCSPFLGAIDYPVVKLRGNFTEHVAADRIQITICREETDDALFLLKRLDEPVE